MPIVVEAEKNAIHWPGVTVKTLQSLPEGNSSRFTISSVGVLWWYQQISIFIIVKSAMPIFSLKYIFSYISFVCKDDIWWYLYLLLYWVFLWLLSSYHTSKTICPVDFQELESLQLKSGWFLRGYLYDLTLSLTVHFFSNKNCLHISCFLFIVCTSSLSLIWCYILFPSWVGSLSSGPFDAFIYMGTITTAKVFVWWHQTKHWSRT